MERGDLNLLLDTGGDAPTLLSNMATLGLNPAEIDILVLSHIHGDHVGGIGGILSVNKATTVYVPKSFPRKFKSQVAASARLVEVGEPVEIAEGIYTTGEMGRAIREQSVIVMTRQGLLVITGCAHPGIVSIVAKAKEITGQEVHLVMGGFHLGSVTQVQMKGIVGHFQRLGVQIVAPCHCSGDRARKALKQAYGENCILTGVGGRLELEQ